MNQNLDLVFLNTFDYHTTDGEPNTARHPHPLYSPTNDLDMADINANYSTKYWLAKGLSSSRVIFGMALYGWCWYVTGSGNKPPLQAAAAGTKSYDNLNGLIISQDMIYREQEFCDINNDLNNTGPFCRAGSLWFGYDNSTMAGIKANYVLENNLGGAVLHDISRDDFNNKFNLGKFPMTSAVSAVLSSSFYPTTTTLTSTTTSTTTTTTTTTPTTLITTTPAISSPPTNGSNSTMTSSLPTIPTVPQTQTPPPISGTSNNLNVRRVKLNVLK